MGAHKLKKWVISILLFLFCGIYLGYSLLDLRSPEAKDAIRIAQIKRPNAELPAFMYGIDLLHTNGHREAINWFKALIDEDEPMYSYGLAWALYEAQQYFDAGLELERLRQRKLKPIMMARINHLQGMIFFETFELEKAARHYNEAYSIYSSLENKHTGRFNALIHLAQLSLFSNVSQFDYYFDKAQESHSAALLANYSPNTGYMHQIAGNHAFKQAILVNKDSGNVTLDWDSMNRARESWELAHTWYSQQEAVKGREIIEIVIALVDLIDGGGDVSYDNVLKLAEEHGYKDKVRPTTRIQAYLTLYFLKHARCHGNNKKAQELLWLTINYSVEVGDRVLVDFAHKLDMLPCK